MGVSLIPNNGPEKDEGLTYLTDSLAQLSLHKPEFSGIDKSFAQISLESKEEEVEEEDGKVKDAEEEVRGQDIDEKEHKTERTDEEEREKKHEVVETDKKLAKGDEEERREEKEEEDRTEEIEKQEKEVCPDDLSQREVDLKESEKVLGTDVKTKEDEKSSKVTITSIPKDEDKDVIKLDAKVKTEEDEEHSSDEDKDVIKLDAKVKTEKTETEEDEEHSSDEESSDEEEEEDEDEEQKSKASGKALKYRSRGIDQDNRSDLFNIIEYHSPGFPYTHDHSPASYFPQSTQPQFHHSPQYEYPSYSIMSPPNLGMAGLNEQTSLMTDGAWFPLSPAPSSTDDNDSNLSYNDLTGGRQVANDYSQLNDQYNQPLQIGDQYQYGQCSPQQIQPGAPFIQLVSSHSQAQSLVPDYYGQLNQEESSSPQMYSCSPQQQSNFLFGDQPSPQPIIQSTEYSEKLELTCELLKNEVENPSRTQYSEAEVAPIKEDLIASINKAFQETESVQPANYIRPANIQPYTTFQPDYTWDMKCNDPLFMEHYKLTASWSNDYVTCIDQDGDTPSMMVACKPVKMAGYAEKLRAVVERQKGVDMCCNQVVAQDQGDLRVCQLCHNSNSLNFHSSLGIRNKQGDTIMSSVVRMCQPASVIKYVLENLRPADLCLIFTSGDAQFYAGYAQYYPELQKYQ